MPTGIIPFQLVDVDDIHCNIAVSRKELEDILDRLEKRGLLYSGETDSGKRGYALHQLGYGFPQTFFWKGEESPHARRMAGLVAKYSSREVIREGYSHSGEPKPYRYVPIESSLEAGMQAVYPHHALESVINQAERIAVGHCPCRMIFRLNGRTCEHPVEVCLKFNRLADYVIEKELAREVDKGEAEEIIRKAEDEGLVHFVDNAASEIQHCCNCCGCACWHLGNIRRRKIARDTLMETYFIRETIKEDCDGCGLCEEICPVEAVKMKEKQPLIEEEWCIGCGVCATCCPNGAALVRIRSDKSGNLPADTFQQLHGLIFKEKGLV